MAGWRSMARFYRRSTLRIPRDYYSAPRQIVLGGVKGRKICWENCRVCCARFFRGRLEEHRTRRAEEGVEKLRRKFVKLVKLRRLLQLFV